MLDIEKYEKDIFSSEFFLFVVFLKIISQKGDGKELLSVDLSLFTYPENYEKPIDVYDCDVKVEFAKANIVFLFKHIGALLVNNFDTDINDFMSSLSHRVFSIL